LRIVALPVFRLVDLGSHEPLQTPEIAVVNTMFFEMHDRVVEVFGS
jgi:hypothetical protein